MGTEDLIEDPAAVPAPPRLSPLHTLMAQLDGIGKGPSEIAELLGISRFTVYQARKNPEYMFVRDETLKLVREKLVDGAVGLADKFNIEAMSAFETLRELHKRADSDSVRLNAAKDILDRAPDAPKVKKEGAYVDARTIISIPVKSMQVIEEALADVGEIQMLELLEEVPTETAKAQGEVKSVNLDEYLERSVG